MTKRPKAIVLTGIERELANQEWRTMTIFRAAERIDYERHEAERREKEQRAHAARCIWRAYGAHLQGRAHAQAG